MLAPARRDAAGRRSAGAPGGARRFLRPAATYVALGVCALPFLLPFYWLVSTSVKQDADMFATPTVWIPTSLTLSHYTDALDNMPFWQLLGNTVYICLFAVVGTLASCSLVAYGLARLEWPGRNLLLLVTLATIMLPYPVTLVPTFIIFKWLHWIGTFGPLTWPNLTGNAFFIFLLRQFFMTIPFELSESARIDGAMELRIFWNIILPLARSALVATALFTFLGNWNDFLGPLIYLTNQDTYTLALGLLSFLGGHGAEWGPLTAASILMTLPSIVLFFLAQRAFVEGITLTGIKE